MIHIRSENLNVLRFTITQFIFTFLKINQKLIFEIKSQVPQEKKFGKSKRLLRATIVVREILSEISGSNAWLGNQRNNPLKNEFHALLRLVDSRGLQSPKWNKSILMKSLSHRGTSEQWRFDYK